MGNDKANPDDWSCGVAEVDERMKQMNRRRVRCDRVTLRQLYHRAHAYVNEMLSTSGLDAPLLSGRDAWARRVEKT